MGKMRMWLGIVWRVLYNTGVTMRSRSVLYKAMVKTVMLYRSDSWVITESMMKVLEEFHHQILRRLTRKTTRRVR